MTIAADETLRQLGGSNRLKVMINAKYFTHSDNGATLTFQFSGCKFASHMRIKLNARDMYDVHFIKVGRKSGTLQSSVAADFFDIGCENLKSTIEKFTGLRLSI